MCLNSPTLPFLPLHTYITYIYILQLAHNIIPFVIISDFYYIIIHVNILFQLHCDVFLLLANTITVTIMDQN